MMPAVQHDSFLGYFWTNGVAIGQRCRTAIMMRACDIHSYTGGTEKVGAEDENPFVQLHRQYEGAKSKDGGVR
jgi:hypothetical protein